MGIKFSKYVAYMKGIEYFFSLNIVIISIEYINSIEWVCAPVEFALVKTRICKKFEQNLYPFQRKKKAIQLGSDSDNLQNTAASKGKNMKIDSKHQWYTGKKIVKRVQF